jgi:pre-mRNA-processing factor 17
MNTLTGFVEDHAMSDQDFKQQQRSYYVNGYAMNPSLLGPVDETGSQLMPYVGPNQDLAFQNNGAITADLKPTRQAIKAQKRKRKDKGTLGEFDDPDEPPEESAGEDIEGAPVAPPKKSKEYLGPWAGWEEPVTIVDDGPEFEEVEEHFKKSKPIIERSKREIGFGEEKSVFHGELLLVGQS